MKIRFPFNPPFFLPALVLVTLAIVTSVPSYLIRYGNLNQSELVEMYFWEALAVLFIPLTGIVASAYGWISKDRFWAALIGVGPYFPKLFLGIPVSFIIGIPMGLMGAGVAMIRQESRIGIGLLVLGIIWWSFAALSLSFS